MLIIRCAKCRSKLIKYRKHGKGKLLRCWKDRIVKNNTVKTKKLKVQCPYCGNILGIDEGAFIKMKSGSFTISGKYE